MSDHVGIDLGGSSVKIGLVDDNYEIVRRITVPNDGDLSFNAVMDRIEGGVNELLNGKNPASIGIGVPSTVLNKRIAIQTPNLNWRNCDVGSDMQRRFGMPCSIGNDADCAALGEYLAGAGKGCESMLLLTLGSGVGGGYVFRDRIVLGKSGSQCYSGIEAGHMKIVDGGKLCGCGRRGCLEAYASATALKREIREAVQQPSNTILKQWLLKDKLQPNAKMVFDAAAMKDAVGERLLANYIHFLAIGISNCISITRAERIVLGGGICAAGDALFVPLNEHIQELTYGGEFLDLPQAIPATLGNDAGIIGAAFI